MEGWYLKGCFNVVILVKKYRRGRTLMKETVGKESTVPIGLTDGSFFFYMMMSLRVMCVNF